MKMVEQTYLEELSRKLYESDEDFSAELFDIVMDLIVQSEVYSWKVVYEKYDLMVHVIDTALKETKKKVSYGWNGDNVMALLNLIDTYSEEV